MMKIGYRTIKTAIGAATSIGLAQLLNLPNFTAAAIITMLCIQVTQRQSFQTAIARFKATIFGVLFAVLLFTILGYHPYVIALLLLVFIPFTVRFKMKEGIATSTVVMLHFYAAQHVTFELLRDEFLLLTIGIGVALIVNLYMPSVERELKKAQQQVELLFQSIFKQYIYYLRGGEEAWDGAELLLVNEQVAAAKSLAFRDVENHFLRNENNYYHYFKIREKQLEILERLLPLIASIQTEVKQAEQVASFMDELSDCIHPGNTAKLFISKLNQMRRDFQTMPLPTTRAEFEARAALVQVVRELDEYLTVKSELK